MSSYFLNGTPILEIVMKNPIMDKVFPAEGRVIAVIDIKLLLKDGRSRIMRIKITLFALLL